MLFRYDREYDHVVIFFFDFYVSCPLLIRQKLKLTTHWILVINKFVELTNMLAWQLAIKLDVVQVGKPSKLDALHLSILLFHIKDSFTTIVS